MPSEERQFWYAITLVGSGLVMIGTTNQNGWGVFLTFVGGLWILYLERERIRAGFVNLLNGLWKSAPAWLSLRSEVAEWRPLTATQKQRLRDALIAIDHHSILIEHNPNSDCVSFAYDLAHLFKDSGWYVLCQPYPSAKPYNGLYFETGSDASEPIGRLILIMADAGLLAVGSHDRKSDADADVLLFVGPKRPTVKLV